MNLHEEITRVAYELYEKSGYIGGRDVENWIEAERIVLMRHASQDIEEPEGEEPMIADAGVNEEVEDKGLRYESRNIEEEALAIEDVREPFLGTKEDIAIKTEGIKPAKIFAPGEKKVFPGKAGQKIRKGTTEH